MSATETTKLVLFGEGVETPFEELAPELSFHTGRPLRRVSVTLRVAARASDEFGKMLTGARDAEGALEDTAGQRWLVAQSSFSYRDGDSVHIHTFELREYEELKVDRLELHGLALSPSKYKEEASSEGGIVVSLVLFADAETDAALERLLANDSGDYFDVVRVGITDEPLSMRFGRCLWQETPSGRLHLLRLVSEVGDDETARHGFLLLQPEFGRVAEKALAADEVVQTLIDELTTAGVLAPDVAARIQQRVADVANRRKRELDETSDLGMFF